jgi:hypothetical protein
LVSFQRTEGPTTRILRESMISHVIMCHKVSISHTSARENYRKTECDEPWARLSTVIPGGVAN